MWWWIHGRGNNERLTHGFGSLNLLNLCQAMFLWILIMSKSHKEGWKRILFLLFAATSYKKMLWKCLWCWLWSIRCINQKVAKLQKATGRKWRKRLNNSAFLRFYRFISIQILTVNYSTEAELSAACNLWRQPFTSDKKNSKTHTFIVFDVKKISKTLGPVWDQWVRPGTKAAKLSNSSWQLLRIWVTPHPHQLLMKMSHLFETTLPIWGGSTRGKMLSRSGVAVWSTQGNDVFLEACSQLHQPPPAYPRLAALALLEPSVRNIKQKKTPSVTDMKKVSEQGVLKCLIPPLTRVSKQRRGGPLPDKCLRTTGSVRTERAGGQ